MAAACGIVIIKDFNYRGVPGETWSNKYWLSGPPPSGSSAWRTLFDQLVAIEKTLYLPSVRVIGGIGYEDDTPGAHAAYTLDLRPSSTTVIGTLSKGTDIEMAGDQAGTMSWRTDRKSSRGKWIYLRKYFHGGTINPVDTDSIAGVLQTAMVTFGDHLHLGDWAGGRVIRSQKQSEVLQASDSSPWVTTRTLKRRGKRPLDPSTRSLVASLQDQVALLQSSLATKT